MKKTISTQKIKEIIQIEWKSTNTVQDVIKKLYIKKRNKPYWLFFFIGVNHKIKKVLKGANGNENMLEYL